MAYVAKSGKTRDQISGACHKMFVKRLREARPEFEADTELAVKCYDYLVNADLKNQLNALLENETGRKFLNCSREFYINLVDVAPPNVSDFLHRKRLRESEKDPNADSLDPMDNARTRMVPLKLHNAVPMPDTWRSWGHRGSVNLITREDAPEIWAHVHNKLMEEFNTELAEAEFTEAVMNVFDYSTSVNAFVKNFPQGWDLLGEDIQERLKRKIARSKSEATAEDQGKLDAAKAKFLAAKVAQ